VNSSQHSRHFARRAERANPATVRDLATFEVDLGVTEKLSEEVPNDIILVSESGISALEHVEFMKGCGVNAVLVGEALMRNKISIAELRN